jgi:hypothetical protein
MRYGTQKGEGLPEIDIGRKHVEKNEIAGENRAVSDCGRHLPPTRWNLFPQNSAAQCETSLGDPEGER